MQVYEVEAYLGEFAHEYDVETIAREATDDMGSAEFSELCEAHKQAQEITVTSASVAKAVEEYEWMRNKLIELEDRQEQWEDRGLDDSYEYVVLSRQVKTLYDVTDGMRSVLLTLNLI